MTDQDRRFIARVIGVDPGKKTGIAVADLEFNGTAGTRDKALLGNFTVNVLETATVGEAEFARAWRVLIQDNTVIPDIPLVVVNEHYVVTRISQQSQDTQSLTQTGALKAVMDVLEVPYTYYTQLPSEAKLLINETRLKQLVRDLNGVDGHARDALRHVFTWCSKYVHSKVEFPKPNDE